MKGQTPYRMETLTQMLVLPVAPARCRHFIPRQGAKHQASGTQPQLPVVSWL